MRTVEIASAILLALATVAIAWSSYQSARWGGVHASSYSSASAARVESTRASTEAGQLRQIDLALFTQWLNAYAEDRTELADFYRVRFRDEFQPAFEAWVATHPRTNPDAPRSPFAMPEYMLAASDDSDRLVRDAERFSAQAHAANQRSDNYVLCVVLFASVLFFAGISTKFESQRVKLAMLGLAAVGVHRSVGVGRDVPCDGLDLTHARESERQPPDRGRSPTEGSATSVRRAAVDCRASA